MVELDKNGDIYDWGKITYIDKGYFTCNMLRRKSNKSFYLDGRSYYGDTGAVHIASESDNEIIRKRAEHMNLYFALLYKILPPSVTFSTGYVSFSISEQSIPAYMSNDLINQLTNVIDKVHNE